MVSGFREAPMTAMLRGFRIRSSLFVLMIQHSNARTPLETLIPATRRIGKSWQPVGPFAMFNRVEIHDVREVHVYVSPTLHQNRRCVPGHWSGHRDCADDT